MDLHQSQKDNNFVFSNSTFIKEIIVDNSTENSKIPAKVKKKKKKRGEKKKTRCSHQECRRKLKLTDMECRCHKRYCSQHRLPESHICSWDPKCVDEMQNYIKMAGLDNAIRFSKLESI